MYFPAIRVQRKVVFDGDSLNTRGNGNIEFAYLAPIAAYTGLTLPKKVAAFFVSISGRTLDVLITEFPTKVLPLLKPNDIVVNNEWVNTLAAKQDVQATYNAMLQYQDLVKAAGCKFVTGTMTASAFASHYANIETDRLALNTMILANAATLADGVADPGSLTAFNSVAATADTTYYNSDKLHFTTAGYNLYGGTFTAPIQALI